MINRHRAPSDCGMRVEAAMAKYDDRAPAPVRALTRVRGYRRPETTL
jgi:hypothetical protein